MNQQRKFFVLLALCANFAAQLSAQKLLPLSVAVSTKTLGRKTFPGRSATSFCAPNQIAPLHKAVILRACDFFDLFVFST